MNPELMRLLWLDATPKRLLLMLGVIIAVSGLIALTDQPFQTLRSVTEFAIFALLGIWGARNAAGSITTEIRDRTWDVQKMSAMSPWAMTWGKWLGSTAYVWFGAAICMVIWTIAFLLGGQPEALADVLAPGAKPVDFGHPLEALNSVAAFIVGGVAAQLVALFAACVSARRVQKVARLDDVRFAVLGALVFNGVMGPLRLAPIIPDSTSADITWWGFSIPTLAFLYASVVLWSAMALFGAWRLLRRELSMPHQNYGWLLFGVLLATYVTGFAFSTEEGVVGLFQGHSKFVAFGVLGFVTLLSAFAEPKNIVTFRWLGQALRRGNLVGFWARQPGFTTGLLLTSIMAIISAIGLAQSPLPVLWFEDKGLFGALVRDWTWPIAWLGVLFRDISILLFFSFARKNRRGEFAALVVMGLMMLGFGTLTAFNHGLAASLYPFIGAGVLEMLLIWAQALVWAGAAIIRLRELTETSTPDAGK